MKLCISCGGPVINVPLSGFENQTIGFDIKPVYACLNEDCSRNGLITVIWKKTR